MNVIIRRVMRLAIVALILGGGYYLGSKYLWPAPDTSTIQTVGIIEAPEVNITSRIAGRIVELDLLEGDRSSAARSFAESRTSTSGTSSPKRAAISRTPSRSWATRS